jgi:RNA polymerase sigma-70 factor (ECF subfamily)
MPLDHDTIVRALLRDRARLHAYVWAIVRDEHVAEDVFQDVSVLAIAKREEIADEAHLAAWLRKAARFESLKALRNRKSRPVAVDEQVLDLLEAQWGELDLISTHQMTHALRRCLGTLTPSARQILQLRYVQGLSGQQVAAQLHQKTHSIYVAIGRIHQRLAECMRRRMGEDLAV